MNSILIWVGVVLILLWPLSFIIGLTACMNIRKIGSVCLVTAFYMYIGWIISFIGLVLAIVGAVVPSTGSSSNNTKRRSNNQELEGGRRRK
jgi:hypothetical protein